MAEIDETELCLVCNKPASHKNESTTGRKSDRLKRKKKNSKFEQSVGLVDSSKDEETHLLLLPQLRVVFLLKQIFKQTLCDDGILEIMRKLGDPSEWCEICLKCTELVDEGAEVIRKLKFYEEERKRIVSTLKAKFTGSYNDDVARKKYRVVQNKTRQFSKVRLDFRNRVRGFAVDIKREVVVEEPSSVPSHQHLDDRISNDENEDLGSPSCSRDDFDEALSCSGEQQNDIIETIGDKKEILTEKCDKKKSLKTLERNGTIRRRKVFKVGAEITPYSHALLRRKHSKSKDKAKNIKLKRVTATSGEPKSSYGRESVEIDDDLEESTYPLPIERGPGRPTSDFFEEKARRHLDMNLVPYPPRTLADMAKIPTEVKCRLPKEEGVSLRKTEFPCPSCGKYFANKYYAIAHIQRVHLGIESPWKCNECEKTTSNYRRMRYHVYKDHQHGKFITCPICKKYGSIHKDIFDNHVLNHEKEKDAPTCHVCGASFNGFHIYLKHMKEEHGFLYSTAPAGKNIIGTFVCELCSATFTVRKRFDLHKVKVHAEVDKEGLFPICAECGEVVFDEKQLEKHEFKMHGRGSMNYFCECCGRGFVLKWDFNSHVKSCVDKTIKNCPICGAQTTSKSLQRHIGLTHPETVKMTNKERIEYVKKQNEDIPFKCKICSQQFAFRNLLYLHRRNDHPEHVNKFNCPECGKGFSWEGTVKRHYESVHLKVEHKCESCERVFYRKSYLMKHQKLHCKETKRKINEKQETPFKCKICSQQFALSKQLYHHRRNDHLEVTEKFKCSECGEGFSRPRLRRIHYETIHLKVEHKCEGCERIFYCKDHLTRHQKIYCDQSKKTERT